MAFKDTPGSDFHCAVCGERFRSAFCANMHECPALEPPERSNVVNHPSHYNQGRIEVIEFIEDKGLSFHRGNAIKYIARAGLKDPNKEIEDIDKAIWYLRREIELIKARTEGRATIKPNDMLKEKSNV